MRKINKLGEFSFEWIFALIAGGMILILAIYGATKLGQNEQYESDTKTAKEISILTDPFQAGFASSSFGKIVFARETKIKNLCSPYGFGENTISVSEPDKISGAGISVINKYIFSTEDASKEFYVYSKPFYLPYRVADLTFLVSKKHCFVFEESNEIEDEIISLKSNIIEIANSSSECSEDSEIVCFDSSSDCDISVYGACLSNCESKYSYGYVQKGSESVNYIGSLMYAAIFSDKEDYECNVQRLLYRAGKIANVFAQKAELMNARDCNTNLKSDLLLLASLNASTQDLFSVYELGKQVDTQNNQELCRIW